MNKYKSPKKRILLPVIRRVVPDINHHSLSLEEEMKEAIKKEIKRQMKKNLEEKEVKEFLEEVSTRIGEDE